ncbi:hypothetical protein Tco_0856785 [Tanacetum coccineum]|uniref:Secreted protein n=1 Tax=Tanacetum coccineum TaxID=301880 RepID=A0ABQ5B5F4_9ASTR
MLVARAGLAPATALVGFKQMSTGETPPWGTACHKPHHMVAWIGGGGGGAGGGVGANWCFDGGACGGVVDRMKMVERMV